MLRCSSPSSASRAFTLVELLVVMGMILVMMALMGPAMNALKGAGDLTKAVYDIAGTLEQARAYAIGNHTYTWVGIGEFDVSKTSSVSPQVVGTGRVVIAVVASKDGTRGYDVLNKTIAAPGWPTNTGATLTAVTPIRYFDNVHLADSGVFNGFGAPGTTTSSTYVGTGNMLRPYITTNSTAAYILRGGTSTGCVTQFAIPLGKAVGAGQYTFYTVVNFDPQGTARIQHATNTNDLARYMEVYLQPTHGTVIDTAAKNGAAIQINCATGRARIYRP